VAEGAQSGVNNSGSGNGGGGDNDNTMGGTVPRSPSAQECILLAACGADELLPQVP